MTTDPDSHFTAKIHLLGDGCHALERERSGTLDDLRQAVTRHVEQRHAIYPQGGRTALDLGGVPQLPGVALETRGLDRVIDYPAADMTITVEAGMTLDALQATLAEHGQRLPLDAPQADRATIGGIYATNTSGPRRFGSGRPRDLIIGVRFVNSAGEVIKGGGRVVKNVAGYDFPRLLTGSLGTLGVIAELTLKVRPQAECSAWVGSGWNNLDALNGALERLNTSSTRPIALELLNRSGADRLNPPSKLPEADWLLAVGFEGTKAAVDWQLNAITSELSEAEVVPLRVEDSDTLWAALNGFQAVELGMLTFKTNLPPSRIVCFVSRLDPSRWALQSHAGNGIVWGHALGDWSLEEMASELAHLRSFAVDVGGNLTLPRCPTDWKATLPVWGAPRGDWAIAERIKRALDPSGLMNPGRFVGTI